MKALIGYLFLFFLIMDASANSKGHLPGDKKNLPPEPTPIEKLNGGEKEVPDNPEETTVIEGELGRVPPLHRFLRWLSPNKERYAPDHYDPRGYDIRKWEEERRKKAEHTEKNKNTKQNTPSKSPRTSR